MVIENILHGINPSAQMNTHKNIQGMTENHQGNIAPGHPWVSEKSL